jgi:kinetochore protein Spc7/SPC105
VLEEINKKAQEILPSLRADYEQIMQELEREQAEVAEIENCDQDYLKELKTSIAEQKFVIPL